jgi:hypothetical protein
MDGNSAAVALGDVIDHVISPIFTGGIIHSHGGTFGRQHFCNAGANSFNI